MKKILWIALGAVVVCVSLATSRNHTITSSGRQVTQERAAGDFSGVSVATGITVYLRQGDAPKVVVRTDERAAEYVVTEVRNGELRIRYADHVQVRRIKTAVYVTAREINSLKASSGGDIEIKETICGEELEVSASSAGDIEGKVEYRSISISASSGGDVELSGKADRVKASASSGGDVDLGSLRANIVSVSASSGGDATVWAVEQITASASSGADITYRGNPATRNISRSSGGSVSHK